MADNIKILESEMVDLAQFFKIFGDPTRLKILNILIENSKCVGEIAESLGMEQSAVSHQLRLLKQMKLVVTSRDGKQISYSLADDHISEIFKMGLEHIREED